jgi:hydroxyacylglutathione hydrolase
MKIEQFEDKNLSHFSYAIRCERKQEIVLIDPARDPQPYYDLAEKYGAKIIGVIETHPHADFVSSHLQIHQQTGAKIFVSKLTKPDFPYIPFDEGAALEFGSAKLKAVNTPGHSPDSISVVLEFEGKDLAVFTGDTLFIGDCGRPDLREEAENLDSKREELAKKMYNSLRNKLMNLNDDLVVYPAHGAGTLCGKALSDAKSSTMGAEKRSNWSLQELSEAEFVTELTADQPFIPKYFPYDLNLNKKGAPNLKESLAHIELGQDIFNAETAAALDPNIIIIDSREALSYKNAHLKNSINIMDGEKFETWLGALVSPGDPFYLAATDRKALTVLLERVAKIGYEPFVKAAFVLNYGDKSSPTLDFQAFKKNPSAYTVVDIRNTAEVESQPIFKGAINIPLPELSNRLNEIPISKPIVVHCAAGYRSAAGSSILEDQLNAEVFDLSDYIKDFIGDD